MDIKALRGLSGTYNVRANERDRVAPRDIECLVHFLDNTQHKFVVDRRSKGQALLESVFKHLNLIETDFFGLKYFPQEIHHKLRQHDAISKGEFLGTSQSGSYVNLSSSSTNNYERNNTSPIQRYNNSPNSVNNLSSSPTNSHNSTILNNHHNVSAEPYVNVINKPVPTGTTKTTSQHFHDTKSSSTTTITTPPIYTRTTTTTIHKITPIVNNIGICINNNNNNNIVKSSDFKTPINNNSGNSDDNSPQFVEERWLDPTKSIRKQYKSGPPFKFYFRVRFYVSDPGKLADDATRNHLYLQLRQDILNNRLSVPTSSAILLASYILQSAFGDYKRELLEDNYAAQCRLLPVQNDDLLKKVIELHKQHKSLSSADAEYQFLEHAAKELDCYGVRFYDAKDQFKINVSIGVSSAGIVVFRDNKRISRFSWAKIIKIIFKKKMFSIQIRRDGGEDCDNFIEFNLLSNQACKSFWEECVAQHSFFGLHQPKSPPKKFFSFLNFGSKFQYNGKTEYQTMEESRKRTTFSHFSRTLSQRYARRTLPIGRPTVWSEQTSTQDNNSDAQSHISSTSNSSNTKSINSVPTIEESIKTIKKGLENGDLIAEFEKMSRKKEDESHEESRLMENIDKNRYMDILPYDSTRVQLIDSMTGDYINASFVDMAVPRGAIHRYIATQGPLSTTCDDFWQMVWEQNSSLIIMVTPLVEAGRVKCHKYWPDEKQEIRYGQIIVRNLNEKSKSATIDRTIQLMDAKTGEKRLTTQIQYKAWPDHEVPEDCSDFLKLVNRVKKHRLTDPKEPIVVHCSAGIGRTGVLILMETAISFMEAGDPISPIKILEGMRKQRAMLIQTSSQFRFVAEAICKVYDQKLYKKTKKNRRK